MQNQSQRNGNKHHRRQNGMQGNWNNRSTRAGEHSGGQPYMNGSRQMQGDTSSWRRGNPFDPSRGWTLEEGFRGENRFIGDPRLRAALCSAAASRATTARPASSTRAAAWATAAAWAATARKGELGHGGGQMGSYDDLGSSAYDSTFISGGPRFAKGPKGYQRSDERIKRRCVSDRIWHLDRIDASDVEIHVQNGEVTLTGTVTDRRAKWDLENLVDQIGGVNEIHNQLRLRRDESAMSGTVESPSRSLASAPAAALRSSSQSKSDSGFGEARAEARGVVPEPTGLSAASLRRPA